MYVHDYSKEPKGNFMCVDIKSFYASVECIERGLHPLKTLLVVMSRPENAGNGLVLAASPLSKKLLGISNVTRAKELPNRKDLHVVPPRMGLYVEKNIQINNIFRNYVADEDLLEYSIDESFIDLTSSLSYFNVPAQKLARIIQYDVYKQTGLYCTVGLGDNPLLAKLAMDIEAKHQQTMFSEWRYSDVIPKLWPHPVNEVWGIGHRMKKNLAELGIQTVEQLAMSNPFLLKEKYGVMGSQLFAHAWGIDRTNFKERYKGHKGKTKSFGNSQILPRDYESHEISTVLRELTRQVCTRLQRHSALTECVHLSIGYSKAMDESGFSRQKKIPITNQVSKIMPVVFEIFAEFYDGESLIRRIGLSLSTLTFSNFIQLNLFDEPQEILNEQKLEALIDTIRSKYDFTKLIHASSLLEESTAIERSKLIGGHAGGKNYV